MSIATGSQRLRAQLWNGSAWVDAPGDATNGLKVQVQGTVPVSGTFWQTTQPVSAASLPLPSGAAQEHTTAASPHSVRLTDGTTYLGTTAQRLHVDDGGSTLSIDDGAGSITVDGAVTANAGSGPFPVSDNSGSLTVDAPVGTPVFVRLSDGSSAIATLPVSAASLPLPTGAAQDSTLTGGTVKAINRGGAKGATTAADVTSTAEGSDHQAMDVQLYHGGTAKDPTQIRALTSADVVTTNISDGTDVATVIPRGSSPTSSDKGLAVMPLYSGRPGYQVVSSEITSATATGVKENLTLWHPNTLAKDVFILEIGVNVRVVQTAGTFAWEMQYISAENGTPGGTTLTAQPLNLGSAASGLTIRQVPTGAPTTTGQIFQRASFPLPAAATPFDGPANMGTILYRAHEPDDALQLRASQNEGLRITQNIIATLTTAPIFTVYVRYIERA